MKKEWVKKFGIWLLAVGLVVAHIFFTTTARAAEVTQDSRYYTKGGECSIIFPATPALIQQSLKVAEGQYLTYDMYLAPQEDRGIFMLLVATYPFPLSGGHEIAGLEGLLKGIVGHNPDNKLIFANLIEHAGYPAMNFLVKSLSNYFRGYAVMIGNKLFLIAMEGRKSEMDEKIFTKFLESFHLDKHS